MENFTKKYQQWEQGKWSNIIYIIYSSVAIVISLATLWNLDEFVMIGFGDIFGSKPILVTFMKLLSSFITMGVAYFAFDLFAIKEHRKAYSRWLKFLGSVMFGFIFFSLLRLGSSSQVMKLMTGDNLSVLFGTVTKQQAENFIRLIQFMFSFLGFTLGGLIFTIMFYIELYRNSKGSYSYVGKEGAHFSPSYQEPIAAQKPLKQVWAEQPKALKRGLFGAGAAILLILIGIGGYRFWDANFNYTTINTETMFHVTFEGFDGKGQARIDRTHLELVDIGMYAAVFDETVDGGDKVLKMDQVISPAQKEKYSQQVEFFQTIHTTNSEGSLSNGDDFEIKLNYDANLAKKSKIKFSSDTVSFKVSGLTKIAQSIDEVNDITTLNNDIDSYVSTLDIKPQIAGKVSLEGIYVNDPALRDDKTATKSDSLSIAYVYHAVGEREGFMSNYPFDKYYVYVVREVILDEEGNIVLDKPIDKHIKSTSFTLDEYSPYETVDDYMSTALSMKKMGGE